MDTLARTNVGKIDDSDGDRVGVSIDTLVSAAVDIINTSAANGKARLAKRVVKKVRISKDQVYDPAERIRCAAEAEKQATEAATAKLQKEQARKHAKEAKVAEKLSRVCKATGCTRVSRGGKLWSECTYCNYVFCPAHSGHYEAHLGVCI
jgi:hypothetical protein